MLSARSFLIILAEILVIYGGFTIGLFVFVASLGIRFYTVQNVAFFMLPFMLMGVVPATKMYLKRYEKTKKHLIWK